MMPKERINYALSNLKYRKLRTGLTILGIVVGIAAIIVLISLAVGLKESVNSQFSSFDARTIIVVPIDIERVGSAYALGAAFRPTSGKLFLRDYQKVRSVAGVKDVAKMIGDRAPVKYKNQIISATIYAVEPNVFRDTTTLNIEEGRFLYDSDSGVAVLGNSLAGDTFDEDIKVGSSIEIAERKYRIVGVLERTGNTFSQLDNAALIKFDEGRSIFSDSLLPNEISGMRVVVAEGYDVDEVGDRVEEVLMNLHKVRKDEKDFGIISATVINEQVDSVIEVLTLFLGAVAMIALAVGTIGISNTMFMAVMERTKEVGVLKSIGAKKFDILLIFLIEAGMIGLIGGIVGVLLGVAVSSALSFAGVQTKVTLELVFGSAVFAFVIGIAAGGLPAKNASDIPAIEALRYE